MQLDLSSAIEAAKNLLGWKLVHKTPLGTTSGYIVETEAYSSDDAASHTYKGQTTRNAAMFEQAGTIYIYFTYGMHYCFNIVTGPKGNGQGVLLRALEPTDGIELMQHRRGGVATQSLTNGPAKLVQAMGITLQQSGSSIFNGSLYLETGIAPGKIIRTTRVGITKAIDEPWRFYIANNKFVSKK